MSRQELGSCEVTVPAAPTVARRNASEPVVAGQWPLLLLTWSWPTQEINKSPSFRPDGASASEVMASRLSCNRLPTHFCWVRGCCSYFSPRANIAAYPCKTSTKMRPAFLITTFEDVSRFSTTVSILLDLEGSACLCIPVHADAQTYQCFNTLPFLSSHFLHSTPHPTACATDRRNRDHLVLGKTGHCQHACGATFNVLLQLRPGIE